MSASPSEASGNNQSGYSGELVKSLTETGEARIDYADRLSTVDVRPVPEGTTKLPFWAEIDGHQHDVLATISVAHTGQRVGPQHGIDGVERAINEAKDTYSIMRDPMSGRTRVVQLSPQEVSDGSCFVSTTTRNGRTIEDLVGGTAFRSNQIAMSEDPHDVTAVVSIEADPTGQSFEVAVKGNRGVMGIVAQPVIPQ
jgi:hypothetical protein